MKPKYNRVGILFSGGPAPSANAVISSVALSFLDNNVPVIGIMRGYEFLQDFNKNYPKLRKEVHYGTITYEITKARNRGAYFSAPRARTRARRSRPWRT